MSQDKADLRFLVLADAASTHFNEYLLSIKAAIRHSMLDLQLSIYLCIGDAVVASFPKDALECTEISKNAADQKGLIGKQAYAYMSMDAKGYPRVKKN